MLLCPFKSMGEPYTEAAAVWSTPEVMTNDPQLLSRVEIGNDYWLFSAVHGQGRGEVNLSQHKAQQTLLTAAPSIQKIIKQTDNGGEKVYVK